MIEYWFHVHQSEGQSRLQRVLELPSAHDDPAARGAALVAFARLVRERGDLDGARAYGTEGLRLARELGYNTGIFWAAFTLSWTFAFQHDWATTEALLRECLQLARALGDVPLAIALGRLGSFRAMQRNDLEAHALLQESLVTLRVVGADLYSAGFLCNLANVALRNNHNADADRHAREALEVAHRLRYAWAWETRAMDLLVRLAAAEQQFERAVRLAGAVSTMHPGLGRLLSRMASPDTVALAERKLGPAEAAAAWAEGQAMTRDQALAFAQQL